MVNRIWQHHFGHGIVDTPSNFGLTGERPTHPELLEYLASRFIEGGWSMKAIHREIMLSAAYQSAYERVQQTKRPTRAIACCGGRIFGVLRSSPCAIQCYLSPEHLTRGWAALRRT